MNIKTLVFFSCIISFNVIIAQTSISKLDSLAKLPITEEQMSPETLWKFGRVGDYQVSPDGKTIVYTLSRYNYKTNKKHTDLFSISTLGGEAKQLTNLIGSEYNPRWTKDSKKIRFISSSQIWEMNADGSNQTKISSIDGGINSFDFAPVGNKVLYCQDVKLDKSPQDIHPDLPLAEVKIIDDLMYKHWNDWHDYKYSHIFISEIKEGEITKGKDIMEDELWDAPLSPFFDNSSLVWSPNGKTIAYTAKKEKGVEYATSTNSDIYLYHIETGITENLTKENLGYDQNPVFSPNGKTIAYQSLKTPGFEADKHRLFIIHLDTKKKEYLTADYDQNADNYVWGSKSQNIYFTSGIHATFQICKINVKSQQVKQITKGVHNYNSFSKTGNLMIGKKMSMSMAYEIFKIDEKTGKETQITFTNQNIYDKITLGEVKERWVTTTDNKQMLVWMIYPPNFDPNKKYPALLYCGGGPQSAVSQYFSYRWNFQIMAAHDYIIMAVNRRGLPSFGEEWNAQISGDYGGQNMKDYISAVDEIKKETFIDETKIGAIGASYGGFSVFWLAGHNENNRFNAFISHCGMFNFESFYGTTEELFFPNHDIGGAYWESPTPKSYDFSPHKYVQNWNTPILITTGEKDFRIAYTESLQAFTAAKLMGVDAKLLCFPKETHFVLKPQNAILWQREFFKWLDTYLK